MKLYFVRHGIADAPVDYRGTDYDRPLTAEGCKRMAREAKALAKLGIAADAIVTSPLARAQQTASIIAQELKMLPKLVEDERLAPDFDMKELASVLRDYAKTAAIVLVGHEPSMSETIGDLIGGAAIDLKKGSVACIDVPDPTSLNGVLLWLAPPKILLKAR